VDRLHSGSHAWRIALPEEGEDRESGVQGVQGADAVGGLDTLDGSRLPIPLGDGSSHFSRHEHISPDPGPWTEEAAVAKLVAAFPSAEVVGGREAR
jgi:hypothetical protein